MITHRWDGICAHPTTISMSFLNDMAGSGVHESLFRSFHILDEVKAMLARGDSTTTVQEFIAWAEVRRERDA